ncbi:MAG TPA: ATP-binding protein [Pirellulales bacterium]|nr:ATP-binding protein [Pirellulales bacterium]
MITSMRVERFRAIADSTARLGPFNVLIGRNDSGKTSFLEAVYALSNSTRSPIGESFWSPWRGKDLIHDGQGEIVRFTAELGSADGEGAKVYAVTLRKAGEACIVAKEQVDGSVLVTEDPETQVGRQARGKAINPDLVPFVEAIKSRLPAAALTRWDLEELGAISMLPPDRKQAFDPTGYGLGTCLAELKLYSDQTFNAISTSFCELFNEFKGIGFRRVVSQYWKRDHYKQRTFGSAADCFEMILFRQDGVEVPASLASGGTLVTLAFLTIAELNGGLLLIEEPENGLHPGRLKEVVEMLRRVCETRPGAQVILTTHSPFLLDYAEPHEVRLFYRDEQNEVRVHHLEDTPDIKDRLKYMMLGELVFNEWDNFVEEIRQHANSGPGRGTE